MLNPVVLHSRVLGRSRAVAFSILSLWLATTATGCRGYALNPAAPHFPWPPPKPSSECAIPRELLADEDEPTLLEVAAKLEQALDAAGYGQIRYFGFDAPWIEQATGFAIVSRLEQFTSDGSPMAPPNRWSTDIPPKAFSFRTFLSALFTAQPGYYRVIVFIATDRPFETGSNGASETEAARWMATGLSGLPEAIGSLPYGKSYTTRAYIYEFEKKTQDHDPEIRNPGRFGGKIHLIQSNIWKNLVGD